VRRHGGEGKHQLDALIRRAFQPQLALEDRLHQIVYYRQAQSRAALSQLGRVKRLEHLVLQFWRDAAAIVAVDQFYRAGVAAGRDDDVALVPAVEAVRDRVHDDVVDDLLQVPRIAVHLDPGRD